LCGVEVGHLDPGPCQDRAGNRESPLGEPRGWRALEVDGPSDLLAPGESVSVLLAQPGQANTAGDRARGRGQAGVAEDRLASVAGHHPVDLFGGVDLVDTDRITRVPEWAQLLAPLDPS